MHIRILGDGPLGRAIAHAATERGDDVGVHGRPVDGRHDPRAFVGADVVVEASRPDAVASNISAALTAAAGGS